MFNRANNTRTLSTDVRLAAILGLHQLPDLPRCAAGLRQVLAGQLGITFGHFRNVSLVGSGRAGGI